MEIFDLFIAEAQRHASLLGEFMQDHEIPLRERAVTDEVFARLRHVGGLAARLRILIIAEIIGIVYYRALEVVTDCRRLQILCRTWWRMNWPTSRSSPSCCWHEEWPDRSG